MCDGSSPLGRVMTGLLSSRSPHRYPAGELQQSHAAVLALMTLRGFLKSRRGTAASDLRQRVRDSLADLAAEARDDLLRDAGRSVGHTLPNMTSYGRLNHDPNRPSEEATPGDKEGKIGPETGMATDNTPEEESPSRRATNARLTTQTEGTRPSYCAIAAGGGSDAGAPAKTAESRRREEAHEARACRQQRRSELRRGLEAIEMARAAAAPLEHTATGRTPTQVLPAVDGTEPHPARQKESNMAAPRPDATPTPPPPTPQSFAVDSKEDDATAGPWQIQSKRRRRRQRQTPLLLPARETAGTVLFRPAGGISFLSASPDAISRQLAAIAGVLEVRVNVQRKCGGCRRLISGVPRQTPGCDLAVWLDGPRTRTHRPQLQPRDHLRR